MTIDAAANTSSLTRW